MINLTKINGQPFGVNPDLLERADENPDTTLITVDGGVFIVKESLADVIELIKAYRAEIISNAHTLVNVQENAPAPLPTPPIAQPVAAPAAENQSPGVY